MTKQIVIENIRDGSFIEGPTPLIQSTSVNYLNRKPQHVTKHVAEDKWVIEKNVSYFKTNFDALNCISTIVQEPMIIELLCRHWDSYQQPFRVCLTIDISKFVTSSSLAENWIFLGDETFNGELKLEYVMLLLDVTGYADEKLSACVQTAFPLVSIKNFYALQVEVCNPALSQFFFYQVGSRGLELISLDPKKSKSASSLVDHRSIEELIKYNIFSPTYPFLHRRKTIAAEFFEFPFISKIPLMIQAFNAQKTACNDLRDEIEKYKSSDLNITEISDELKDIFTNLEELTKKTSHLETLKTKLIELKATQDINNIGHKINTYVSALKKLNGIWRKNKIDASLLQSTLIKNLQYSLSLVNPAASIDNLHAIRQKLDAKPDMVALVQQHISKYNNEYELAKNLDNVLFKHEIDKIIEGIRCKLLSIFIEIENDSNQEKFISEIKKQSFKCFNFNHSDTADKWLPNLSCDHAKLQYDALYEAIDDIRNLCVFFEHNQTLISNYQVCEDNLRALNANVAHLSKLKADYPYALTMIQINHDHRCVDFFLHKIIDNLLYKLNFYHKFIALDTGGISNTTCLKDYLELSADNLSYPLQRIYMPWPVVERILEQIKMITSNPSNEWGNVPSR